MADNRTSQAVEQMAKGGIEHLADRGVRVAIAAKYARMEDVLRLIANNSTDETAQQYAAEAVAFDPLPEAR